MSHLFLILHLSVVPPIEAVGRVFFMNMSIFILLVPEKMCLTLHDVIGGVINSFKM